MARVKAFSDVSLAWCPPGLGWAGLGQRETGQRCQYDTTGSDDPGGLVSLRSRGLVQKQRLNFVGSDQKVSAPLVDRNKVQRDLSCHRLPTRAWKTFHILLLCPQKGTVLKAKPVTSRPRGASGPG